MIVLSNFIWNIEISGNVNIPKQEIIQILADNGFAVGTSKNDMDTNNVISQIRLQRDDIAWIGITVKGTNAIVKIKEADKAPKVLDEKDATHTLIVRLILLEKGTYPTHPDMGVGIVSNYRFAFTEELD